MFQIMVLHLPLQDRQSNHIENLKWSVQKEDISFQKRAWKTKFL